MKILLICVFLSGCTLLDLTPTTKEDIYYKHNKDFEEVEYFYCNNVPFSIDSSGNDISIAAYHAKCSGFKSDNPNQFDTLKLVTKTSQRNIPIQWSCEAAGTGWARADLNGILWKNGRLWAHTYRHRDSTDSIFELDTVSYRFNKVNIDSNTPNVHSYNKYLHDKKVSILDSSGYTYLLDGTILIKKSLENVNLWEKTLDMGIKDWMLYKGCIYLCGFTTPWLSERYEAAITKIDGDGNLKWEKKFHMGDYPRRDYLSLITATPEGSILAIGASGPWEGNNNMFLTVLIDENGELEKETLYKKTPSMYIDPVYHISYLDRQVVKVLALGDLASSYSTVYAEIKYR